MHYPSLLFLFLCVLLAALTENPLLRRECCLMFKVQLLKYELELSANKNK